MIFNTNKITPVFITPDTLIHMVDPRPSKHMTGAESAEAHCYNVTRSNNS